MVREQTKNWLKENWFKTGIVVAIFVLAIVIYGGKGLPAIYKQQLSDKDLLKLSMQCREDGERKFQEDKNNATNERYKTGIVDCYYMEPAFIFNKDLNTCLYSGGYTCDLTKRQTEGIFKGEYAKRWTRHITDVYSNKTLADVYVEDSSEVPNWLEKSINEFWADSKKLGF